MLLDGVNYFLKESVRIKSKTDYSGKEHFAVLMFPSDVWYLNTCQFNLIIVTTAFSNISVNCAHKSIYKFHLNCWYKNYENIVATRAYANFTLTRAFGNF